jgi:hypothetical protein
MTTEIKEPFPLFPITREEREELRRVIKYYLEHPITGRGICSLLGPGMKNLAEKICKAIHPHAFYTEYLAAIGYLHITDQPARCRIHWLRLLINQPTIEDLEDKQDATNKE